MPASQTIEHEHFKMSVQPASRLRRWLGFPLYFQGQHPTFNLAVTRVSGEEGVNAQLPFKLEFSDGTFVDFRVDATSLGVGETLEYEMKDFAFTRTGDTRIVLNVGMRRYVF